MKKKKYIYIYIYYKNSPFECMYVCMYVCMFPKYSQNSTRQRKNVRATLLTILLRCAISSFFQIGQRKKLLKNQFPIQSSTLRENLINANNLSGIVCWSYLFFFLEMIFFINCYNNGNPTGSRVIQYITKTLILYVCMYVPEIQPKRYTIAQKFQCHLTHHSPAVCNIKFL